MSKKKSFSGSTMTLKDFHGGSIPSDLHLPSAPGALVRPSDRPATAWGNPITRSDHRSRPGSSGTARSFDEKASFLSHPPHIGRNFDEDERKPLDGISLPRRTVGDDSSSTIMWAPQTRPDPKPDAGKLSTWQPSSPSPARHPIASPNTASSATQTNAGPMPNAWAVRKVVTAVPDPAPPSSWSGPTAVSKFAQASALEKIQSGRWQSKPSTYNQPDVEVMRYSECESDILFKDNDTNNGVYGYNSKDQINDARGRGIGGIKEFMEHERVRSPIYYPDGVRPSSTEGKLDGGSLRTSQLQTPVEASERPKLKLLPRMKPMENLDSQVLEHNQWSQLPGDSSHEEIVNETHNNFYPLKLGPAEAEGGNRVERPKLNLKPRSQPLEKSNGTVERERNTVFGGARPRELVLKERGVDDVVMNNLDTSQSPVNRAKQDVPQPETKQDPPVPVARYGERPKIFTPDQKSVKDFDRKDHRSEAQKVDMQRGSWRNENRKNGREMRETDKPEQRRPEPETWRKPIEPPKLVVPDTPGPRYGKAASAVELAQVFSRSISDAKTPDGFTNQRKQVPFSRLTDTREFYAGPPPRHINGY